MVMPTRPWPGPPKIPQPEPWPKIGDWHKWFAWYPVTVNGKLQWCKFVYRRKWIHGFRNGDVHGTQYGTIFDVLKNEVV